ncbi:MAG: malate synthase, partial [Chitinophagaceae bacterium]
LNAGNKDVFDSSKTSTLPISREIAVAYIHSQEKLPWFIDLLNINLNNFDLAEAKKRIKLYIETFHTEAIRITENIDFME